MIQVFRQGDVLIASSDRPVAMANKPLQEIPRQDGKIVLARGETTGHAHVIEEADVQFALFGNERVLISPTPFVVKHEEHKALTIPAGEWRVIQQREYTPDEFRFVAD